MLTVEEFRLFRNLIYEESGIFLKDSRKDFLENRIARRMRETGVSSVYWYYKLVSEKAAELVILLDILTINETSFFRNEPQLALFRNMVLPELQSLMKGNGERTLRIWSAGCSTGEEPYTIAMIIADELGKEMTGNARIFASDISLNSLSAANRGEYEVTRVRKSVEVPFLRKYFEENNGCFRIGDSIRKMVVFDYHNLKNDNGLRNLHAIFCRNVMIYFDEEEQKRVVERFRTALAPGGYLLLGHAESLQGKNSGFEFVYSNKGTAYRKSAKEEK